MKTKERQLPVIIPALEALLLRLPANHQRRNQIEDDLRKYKSGFRGEKSIEYDLNFLTATDYLHFPGLRLPFKDALFFQIDSLLLTPHCIFLLEIKNTSGTIFFDKQTNQMIQTLDGKEKAYPCPIQQSNRHVTQLNEWLRKNRFPNIPLVNFVVFTNPSTILRTSADNHSIFEKVCKSQIIPNKINDTRTLYPHAMLDSKQIKQIKNKLLKQDMPLKQDVLKTYGIDKTDFFCGVQCLTCKKLSMMRKNGRWICSICSEVSNVGHIGALVDYLLLVSSTISNTEFRAFLGIQSRSIAAKLLQSLTLPTSGAYRNTRYHLSMEQLLKLVK